MIHINSDLPESHERPHADSANDKGVYIVACEQIDRHHAAALNVPLIFDGGNIFYFAVLNINKGKYIAMTKMSGAGCIHRGPLLPLRLCGPAHWRNSGGSSEASRVSATFRIQNCTAVGI